MARTRNIKPGFFKNDILVSCSMAARLLFAGLWTIADREGRLEDRPMKIKLEIFPGDSVDADALLQELATAEEPFIVRYENAGKQYIQILKFKEHQNPHQKEPASLLPAPDLSETGTGLAPDEPGLLLTSFSLPPSPNQEPNGSTAHRAREPGSVPASADPSRDAFRAIYDHGSSTFPNLATRRTAVIDQWLQAGAIPADVLPEIDRAAQSGVDVRSWGYFTGGVMDAVSSRLKPLPQGQPRTQTQKSMTHSAREAAVRGVMEAGGTE